MNFKVDSKISEETIHGKFILWCIKNKVIDQVNNQIGNRDKSFYLVKLKINSKNICFILFPLTIINEENNYEARVSNQINKSKNYLEFENKINSLIINIQGIINESKNIYLPLIGAGNARILIADNKTDLLINHINSFKKYHITNNKNINIIIWKNDWKKIKFKKLK